MWFWLQKQLVGLVGLAGGSTPYKGQSVWLSPWLSSVAAKSTRMLRGAHVWQAVCIVVPACTILTPLAAVAAIPIFMPPCFLSVTLTSPSSLLHPRFSILASPSSHLHPRISILTSPSSHLHPRISILASRHKLLNTVPCTLYSVPRSNHTSRSNYHAHSLCTC